MSTEEHDGRPSTSVIAGHELISSYAVVMVEDDCCHGEKSMTALEDR